MGLSLKKITGSIRDLFDANTADDYKRREQAQIQANQPVVRQTYAQQQQARGIGRVSNNVGARTINAGKSLWEGFKEAPEYVGKGLSYGSSQQQSTDQSIISQQNQRTQELSNARMRLKDPALSPTQRANYSKFLTTFGSDQDKRNAETEQMTQRNIAGTDPVRGAGYVASMGFDVATAGVGGGAGVGLKVAAKQGSKQFVKRALIEGAKSGLVGAGSGALLAVGQKGRDVTLDDIKQGAAVGGAVGAVLPVASYGAGRVASKALPSVKTAGKKVVTAVDPAAELVATRRNNQIALDRATNPKEIRQIQKGIADLNTQIREARKVDQVGGINNPKKPDPLESLKQPQKMTEEQYLSRNGAVFMNGAEPALHRQPNKAVNAQKNDVKRTMQSMDENNARRAMLRQEYQQKVASGEITAPTRNELLIEKANGLPELESTQAAQRLLTKQGIDWKTSPLESLKQEARKYKSAEEFVYDKGLEHPEYKRRVAENKKYIDEVVNPAKAEANSARRAMETMEKKYVGKKNLKLSDAEKRQIDAEYNKLASKVRKAQELEDNYPYRYPDEGINREKDLTDLYKQATQSQPPKSTPETPIAKSNRLHEEKLVKNKLTQNEYAGLHDKVKELDSRASELHRKVGDATQKAIADASGKPLTPKVRQELRAMADEWGKALDDHVDALNVVRKIDGQEPIATSRTAKPQSTPTVGEIAPTPKPKVTLKKVPISEEQLLDIKIAKVKDPLRKAELLAEREAKQPVIAKPRVQAKPDAKAFETASPYTTAPKTPNAFKRAWMSVNGVISQYGEGGKEFTRRAKLQRELSETGQQQFIDSIPTVTKLSRDDFPRFVQALDDISNNKPPKITPQIAQAIREWNASIPKIRDQAVKAGLDVGDLGPNYFPRQYPDLFKGDRGLGRMAESMVENGKATDIADAMAKLKFMKNEYQKPFGNLEKTREFDMPGYDMTPDALNNYLSRAFDRITKAEQFGAKNEIISQLQATAHKQGFDAAPGSTLDRYMKIALGDVDKSGTGYKVSGAIRQANSVTKLGTGAISNSTQLTNTATVAGIGRTAKAVYRLATSPEARAKARSSGVLLDHTIKNLAEQGLGTRGKITKNIAAPFFSQVEKFNREVTAIVGADYGNLLAKNGKTDLLRNKFGVTGDIGKKLTPNQETEIGRKMVEIAQFKVDPMDLPGWVDSPLGKVVAQFRTFGYKQSEFIWNQVLREFMKGNGAPLARFIAVGVPLGAGSQYVKSKIKGTEYTTEDESNTSQVAKALMAVGGGGLVGSEAQNLYKSAQYDNLEGGLASTLGGPTASTLVETAVNSNKAIKGDPKPIGKQAVRSVPVLGQAFANRLFPKKEQDKKADQIDTATATPAELDTKSSARVAELKKNMVANDYGLEQLPNGRYAATIDGELKQFEDLDKARLASRKSKFEKSDANIKVIGDTVLRKNAGGDVTVTTRDKYDYDLNTAQMSRYKKADNFGEWTKTAEKQLANIEKQLQDPNIDELDRVKLENAYETILDNYDKYASYGGSFTKGKGDGSSADPLKYALDTNIKASLPKVTIKSSGGGGNKVTRKRVAAPKVSIKKSLV